MEDSKDLPKPTLAEPVAVADGILNPQQETNGASEDQGGVAFSEVGDEEESTPPDVSKKGEATGVSESDEDQPEKLASAPAVEKPKSLNSIFGNRVGFWQSMSMILNAALMVYAHSSLSAVFYSNQNLAAISSPADQGPPSVAPPTNAPSAVLTNSTEAVEDDPADSNSTTTATEAPPEEEEVPQLDGACNADDLAIWNGGADLETTDTISFCAQQYQGSGCLLDGVCTTECFQTTVGYSQACAACFAATPSCTLREGCLFMCADPARALECAECNIPCMEELKVCTGLPVVVGSDAFTTRSLASTNVEECEVVDLDEEEDVEELILAYELLFFSAVRTAWSSDARLLAAMVVIFSGFWPYAKNVMLMLVWYVPLTEKRRTNVLKWLRRLGKFTMVDVYIIDLIMIGMTVFTAITPFLDIVIKGEPRLGIIAFLVATLWEFVHIEWMTSCHEEVLRKNETQSDDEDTGILSAMRFRTKMDWNHREPALACTKPAVLNGGVFVLLSTSIVLLVVGSALDVVRFTTILGETDSCVRNYNLYQIGTELVSDFFVYENSRVGSLWTLAISFLLFVPIMPLFVHLVHALVIVLGVRSKMLCKAADIGWTFASVEVLVIAVFTVQYKFEDLLASFAGGAGDRIFGIRSELGPGFYVLVAYSVLGSLVHYFFNGAYIQYYKVDPYHKIDFLWTRLFGSCLGSPSEVSRTMDSVEA